MTTILQDHPTPQAREAQAARLAALVDGEAYTDRKSVFGFGPESHVIWV